MENNNLCVMLAMYRFMIYKKKYIHYGLFTTTRKTSLPTYQENMKTFVQKAASMYVTYSKSNCDFVIT